MVSKEKMSVGVAFKISVQYLLLPELSEIITN